MIDLIYCKKQLKLMELRAGQKTRPAKSVMPLYSTHTHTHTVTTWIKPEQWVLRLNRLGDTQ